MYIIGDVHGCYNTLMALIAKLPKNAKLCFVGDFIGRGPNSKDVVEAEHTKWMCHLPLYVEFPSLVHNGRHLVVSHSSIAKI